MKPDGVATTPAEPAEDVVEPVPEVVASEEQVQQVSSPSSSQLEKLENESKQDGETLALPLPGKEVNGKVSKPKVKTKAPIKTTKPSTAGTKATTTTGAASRPATAQSRVANGVTKIVSNSASKKPEMKKSTTVGVSTQLKKVPTATTVAPRTQVKAAERKTVTSVRPVASTSSGARKPTATSQALNSRPVTGGNNAAVKPKTTAPRPTAAPAAKASVSAASKATTNPKATRPTVATSRPTTSSATVRPTTTASKSTALRTTVSAPSGANSASAKPSKVSATVAAKKEMKTTTSAAARKPLATMTTCSTATKTSKPAVAAKRLHTDTRMSQQKMDKVQVPTRKVPQSPRNISSRTASGRMATEISNHKQVVSSNPVSVKGQTAKPTQSVLPLVIKGKPLEEQSSVPVGPSAVLETAAIAAVESVIEAQVPSVELTQTDQQISALVEGQEEGVQVPAPEPTNVDPSSPIERTDAEPLGIQSAVNVPVLETPNPPSAVQSENVHDYILVVAHDLNEQEHVPASPCEVPVTSQASPKDSEVVVRQEPIICNFEEEEEREGSQQVSLSDMSGTQPTEESRPGSAGLAGSLWRAGGLPSEFDSEDVSCSQQGASELSAPGVLEGTESMDDLGEASLKGADGEGASAGSPDFEKFPDILANEDDDDEDDDHVDDMEVGSEMTEDPHRQCNDNDNDDEDDDVEMASEGVTESGLESYGNADEDDFAEDYRLDNLNRMQPSSIVSALSSPNPFADAWIQSLQTDPILVSSPSSNHWQTYSELPNQPAAQACLDIGSTKTDLSSPVVMDPVPSSTLPFAGPNSELIVGLKQDLASHSQLVSQSSSLPDSELAIHTRSGASTPEELKDYSISPGLEKHKPPSPVSPKPVPDIMQDLGICRSDTAGAEHEEEEPETLPADMLAGLSNAVISAPSSHSSAIGDEASDTDGDMQISDPTEPGSTGNECFDGTQVAHSMLALVEECDACAEMDGGGGDTPQSATSATSYGFECNTSNSNAQSTTESCIKSPGILSLENEEQLPDETKDPSLIKELDLAPAGAPADSDLLDQQEEFQMNSGQQHMLSWKVSEELPETCSLSGTVPIETGLDSSSSEHQQDLDLDAPHSYYSTICEKTDSFLTGSLICVLQQEKVPTVSTRPPKPHGLRVDHVTRLPTDLPPRMPNVGCTSQLRRLEQHQLQLEEIEQRREKQSQSVETQMEERRVKKSAEGTGGREMEKEAEQKSREEKEMKLEEQKRDLLHLQIQQQQQELKQRQQIMQWQQELEQQKQQSKHQKNLSAVLLSPTGLCTIYEGLETSDAEEEFEDKMEEKEMVLKFKVEHECSPKERSSIPETGSISDNPDSSQSQSTSPNPIPDHEGLITHSVTMNSPPLSGTSTAQQLSPLDLDWGKKADIVQHLINQTLLLNGDNCSPLLLLPGGAAGTLSPLETSLWPSLAPLTPTSATVTSVSSYSAELSGSSPKGEWTVVELETHH